MKNLFRSKLVALVIIISAMSCQQESIELEQTVNPTQLNLNIPSQLPELRVDCNGKPDLIIQSITDLIHLLPPSAKTFPFVVTIKNVGGAVATIKSPINSSNAVGWQAWQSKNGVSRDKAVCGFSYLPGDIGVNQTKTETVGGSKVYCFLENLSTYPYMIVDLNTNDNSVDCNKSNNTYVMALTTVILHP